jgi:hypothetical protein
MPAVPTAYKLRSVPTLTHSESDKVIYTRHPPKIQSLAALATPNPIPVNALMAVVAGWSLKKATDPL